MKQKMLAAALVLTLGGSAGAQGLLGTSASFSTSPLCNVIKCRWINQGAVAQSNGRGIWRYQDALDNQIMVTRASAKPSSVVNQGLMALGNLEDDEAHLNLYVVMFKAFQSTFFGSELAPLAPGCFDDGLTELARATRRGVEYTLRCGSVEGVMLWAISPMAWVK